MQDPIRVPLVSYVSLREGDVVWRHPSNAPCLVLSVTLEDRERVRRCRARWVHLETGEERWHEAEVGAMLLATRVDRAVTPPR